jgi:hypothetical protein
VDVPLTEGLGIGELKAAALRKDVLQRLLKSCSFAGWQLEGDGQVVHSAEHCSHFGLEYDFSEAGLQSELRNSAVA